jgi:hypothetical protein
MKAITIFNNIKGINPSISTVSSIGNFVTAQAEQTAEYVLRETIKHLPEDSLAYKIATTHNGTFSEKQIWIIAYELLKNETYCNELQKWNDEIQAKNDAKRNDSKAKLTANKESAQPVLDFVKQNGKKLGDYYTFLKSNKTFKKEFFNKKYTMESAQAFINQ